MPKSPNYFLRNLEKMLPLAGAGAGAVGLGSPAGAGPGALPREGSGRADFWALAGTARGDRVVPVPGRGAAIGPAGFGAVMGTPAGRGVGRGMTPGEGTGFWAAMPGLGAGLRLIFSAWSAAVAGAGAGTAAGRAFSNAKTSLSIAEVS